MKSDPIVKLPCPVHGLTDHHLVTRSGFTPYRECTACANERPS